MVYIASDHNGLEIKAQIIRILKDEGILQYDMGPYGFIPTDDYPPYAFAVCEKVAKDPQGLGILICGTGAGMCIAANKVKGIRAAEAASAEEAKLIKTDDNANVLILSKLDYDLETYRQIVLTWYNTPFSNAERHVRRLQLITDYENGNPSGTTSS